MSTQEANMKLIHDGDSFEFFANSPYQRTILYSALTKHTNLENAEFINTNGDPTPCRAHAGSKTNKVILYFPGDRNVELFTATTDDLDILTLIVCSTVRNMSKLEQFKMINGKWEPREQGSFYRKSVVDELRTLPREQITTMLNINRKYGDYLKPMMNVNRTDLLASLGLM